MTDAELDALVATIAEHTGAGLRAGGVTETLSTVSPEAVRLAHAAVVFAAPDARSPFAVLAMVLAQPPWSLEWDSALELISEALDTRSPTA